MGGINPAILQMLAQKMGQAGGAPGGAPGAGGGEESMSPATRELQGADPGYALKLINSLKKQIMDLIPTLAFKAPAAARALMSTAKGIDTSIKELQQANATMQAVGGPVNMSAIPKPMPPGGSGAPNLMNAASTGI